MLTGCRDRITIATAGQQLGLREFRMAEPSAVLLAQFEVASQAREVQQQQEHQRQRKQLLDRLALRKAVRVERAAGARQRDQSRRGSQQRQHHQLTEVTQRHREELSSLSLELRLQQACGVAERHSGLVAQLVRALSATGSESTELYDAEAAGLLLVAQQCLEKQRTDEMLGRQHHREALERRLQARQRCKAQETVDEQAKLDVFEAAWSRSASGDSATQLQVITVTLGGEVAGDQVKAEAKAILAELHAAATMLRGKEEALKLHTRQVMRQRLAARGSAAGVSDSDSEIGKLLESAMPELQKDLHHLDQQVEQQRQQLTQSHGNELARLLTVHGKLRLTASCFCAHSCSSLCAYRR